MCHIPLNRQHGSYRRRVHGHRRDPVIRAPVVGTGGREPAGTPCQIESDLTFRWRSPGAPAQAALSERRRFRPPSLRSFFSSRLLVPAAIRNPGIMTRLLGQALTFPTCALSLSVLSFILFLFWTLFAGSPRSSCGTDHSFHFYRAYYRF